MYYSLCLILVEHFLCPYKEMINKKIILLIYPLKNVLNILQTNMNTLKKFLQEYYRKIVINAFLI